MATEIENPEIPEVTVSASVPTYRIYDPNKMLNQNLLTSSNFFLKFSELSKSTPSAKAASFST